MGYCIYSQEGSIKIKKENMNKLLETLSNYFKNGEELRWVNGFTMEDEELCLSDIWEDLRYSCNEEKNYYKIDEFIGEKYGDDDKLFTLIAPYCEDGYLQFYGEDGKIFRFVIKDGRFKETFPN